MDHNAVAERGGRCSVLGAGGLAGARAARVRMYVSAAHGPWIQDLNLLARVLDSCTWTDPAHLGR